MDKSQPPVRKISNFRDLVVWQKSMDLAETCYREMSPRIDVELSNQMRRASVSIPSNIAEGHELPTRAYRHHVRIALGSLAELDTQLELVARLAMLPPSRVVSMKADIGELRRMLRSLRASLAGRAPATASLRRPKSC